MGGKSSKDKKDKKKDKKKKDKKLRHPERTRQEKQARKAAKRHARARAEEDASQDDGATGADAAHERSANGANGADGASLPPFSDVMTEFGRRAGELFAQQADAMQSMFARSGSMLNEAMAPAQRELDPMHVAPAMQAATHALALDPMALVQANYALWQKHMSLWQETAEREFSAAAGRDPANAIASVRAASAPRDKRFRDDGWNEQPAFDHLRRSYLITSDWLVETMGSLDGLDPRDRDKLVFHTRLLADAFSPSNFAMTNPEVLKRIVDSGGESLVQGLQNLQRDLDPSTGELKILMNDPDAFELGRNIATTPGKVVWRNALVELIQYTPTTERVHERPLVIVPPWINKFYILDLQPKNSFIRWAVAEGYTVFVMSWVNPDGELGARTFEDYMSEGILESLDAVNRATGRDPATGEVTMIGYCIGGTLLSATLAWMAEKGDTRVKAATFFASQADFSEAGELKLFADEAQLDNLAHRMKDTGVLEGGAMAQTFNLLRARDLIWSFYVDNYLLGKEPLKFDLLYWNSDATRMPRETHLFYLKQMYIENNLSKPGGITLDGVPIDLSRIQIPIYLQASKDDHIAPYPSVFKSTGLYGGPARFVLAGSGHIAGVINPPSANKYQHWLNESAPTELQAWLDGADEHPGSWWDDWDRWLAPLSGDQVPARQPGDGELDVLDDAPGTYVRVKS